MGINRDLEAPEKSFLVEGNAEHKEGVVVGRVGIALIIVNIGAVRIVHDWNALDLLGTVTGEVVKEVDIPGEIGCIERKPRLEVRKGGHLGECTLYLPRIQVEVSVEYPNAVSLIRPHINGSI